MVKQQSLAGFNVKLTPMGSWSVPTGIDRRVYFINVESAVSAFELVTVPVDRQ